MLEEISGLAEILQVYGSTGWAVICMVVIWHLWRRLNNLQDEQRKADKETADRQREADKAVLDQQRQDMQSTIAALIETRDAMRAFKEAMETLARRLEKLED